MIATKTCACGQEIEFEAELARESSCPHCGAPLVEEERFLNATMASGREGAEKKKGNRWRVILTVGLVLIGLAAAVLSSATALDDALAYLRWLPGAFAKEREQKALYHIATNAVTLRLKAPRTAVFDGPKSVYYGDGSGYRVMRGYVDSQNGFGALVRMKWEVKFSQRSEEVYGVEFEEQ